MLEDKMGSISFSMYARAFEQYGRLLESDVPLRVYGRIDLRDETDPKVNIERVEIWKNTVVQTNNTTSKGVLYVRISTSTEQKLVAGVLTMFPGDTPVQAQTWKGGKQVLLEYPMRVTVTDELVKRISNIVGEANVKFVKK